MAAKRDHDRGEERCGDHGKYQYYNFSGAGLRDPNDIFREMMGDDDMGTGTRPEKQSGMDDIFTRPRGGCGGGQETPKKPEPIVREVHFTLEELYRGCTRKLKVTRTVTDAMGKESQEWNVITIDVKPGWKDGTKVTFEKDGDRIPGVEPADVVFVVKEKPHDTFRRHGNDLECTVPINLVQALTGARMTLPHPSGRDVAISVPEVIAPGSRKVIRGEGMPVSKVPGTFGDLIVEFVVTFPTSLDECQKAAVRDTFRNSTWGTPPKSQ